MLIAHMHPLQMLLNGWSSVLGFCHSSGAITLLGVGLVAVGEEKGVGMLAASGDGWG